MEDRIRLSYFYGKEADQFSFYKIPKLLFTEEYFKKISVEAKVLYGLMLDRMSLSMKNQWMDDEGRAFVAVELITHTFDITMAVFDVSQSVVRQAGGIIQGSTAVDASTLATMQSTLEAMELGPLFAIFLQSFIVQFLMYVLSAVIFVIINGRMVEIYLMVSLAPLPFATFGNREQSMMGQNYMRSLFALGFQGFLIMVCVGIYAVLIQSVAFSTDIIASLWKVMGFTILLAFTLFKTGAVAHSIFHAH